MWNLILHVKSYYSLAISQPMNLLGYNQLVIVYFDIAANSIFQYCWLVFRDCHFSTVFHIKTYFLASNSGWLAVGNGR